MTDDLPMLALILTEKFKGEDFLKELLDKQNNLEATALHIAAYHGKTAVLQLLIDKGADLDAADGYGRTAQQPFILFEFSLG